MEFRISSKHGPRWGIESLDDASQRYFDYGMQWLFAFNHEEAIACFHHVFDKAPSAAAFGISYCHGINYNNRDCEDTEGSFPSNFEAAKFAQIALENSSNTLQSMNKERALIEAIQKRNAFPESPESKGSAEEKVAARKALNQAFAEAMAQVFEMFPDDPDVTFFYVDSVMNLFPWDLFVEGAPRDSEGAFPGTATILTILESALKHSPYHLGLLHMHLHALEMSPRPGDALTSCRSLEEATRDSDLGHLLHMPSHIYVLIGNFLEAVMSNEMAVIADERFVQARSSINFYTIYRCHDWHMLVYAALYLGDFNKAWRAASEMKANLMSPEVEKFMEDGMADFLEAFVAQDIFVLIRFGKWNEILEQEFPNKSDLYLSTIATLHYGRGIAFAALKDTTSALEDQKKFLEAKARIPPSRVLFNNSVLAILEIASAMLEGEIQYRLGNFNSAFQSLRQAVRLDMDVVYDEPWPWMISTRHALGALLLEQGNWKEAREAFLQDLRHHPNNIWALRGLELCHKLHPSEDPGLSEHQKLELENRRALATCEVQAPCACMLSQITQ